MEDKYRLNIGCHRHTLTSRDSMSEEYNTYDDAYNAYLDYRKSYARFGYVVWFAEIVSPDGTTKQLESNPYWG